MNLTSFFWSSSRVLLIVHQNISRDFDLSNLFRGQLESWSYIYSLKHNYCNSFDLHGFKNWSGRKKRVEISRVKTFFDEDMEIGDNGLPEMKEWKLENETKLFDDKK